VCASDLIKLRRSLSHSRLCVLYLLVLAAFVPTPSRTCFSFESQNSLVSTLPRASSPVSDFFFQAEDGIRDFHVTGVQTCALPIYVAGLEVDEGVLAFLVDHIIGGQQRTGYCHQTTQCNAGNNLLHTVTPVYQSDDRSEERRVGKESRSRRWRPRRAKRSSYRGSRT